MAYGAGLPGYGAGRGAGYGAAAGGRYGAGTGAGYGAGVVSGSTPLTILGTSLKGWWDETSVKWQDDARTSLVTADGQSVGAWDDLSGGGFHLTNANATKPVHKVNIVNGKSVVRFALASSQYLTNATLDTGTTMFIWVVFKASDVTTAQSICDGNTIAGRSHIHMASGQLQLTSINAGTARGSLSINTWYYVGGGISTGATSYLTINGTSFAAEDLAPDGTGAGFVLGVAGGALNTEPFGGDIVFAAVSNALPNATQKAAMDAYLAARYAI